MKQVFRNVTAACLAATMIIGQHAAAQSFDVKVKPRPADQPVPTSTVKATTPTAKGNELRIDFEIDNNGGSKKVQTNANEQSLSLPAATVPKTYLKSDDYKVSVNKKDETSDARTNELLLEYWKQYDVQPNKQGHAKGTLTENVGADNRSFPIRREISNENGTNYIGNSNNSQGNTNVQARPKADKRQFLTFTTATGKVFYLIINYENDTENVQLLVEANEHDLLNMLNIPPKESPKPAPTIVETPKVTEPVKEDVKKGNGSLFVFIIFGGIALGAAIFIWMQKQQAKKDNFKISELQNNVSVDLSEKELEEKLGISDDEDIPEDEDDDDVYSDSDIDME